MTVAELIEELQHLPPHLPVLVEHPEWKEAEDPAGFPMRDIAHASVAAVQMKYNHVILDATGGIL